MKLKNNNLQIKKTICKQLTEVTKNTSVPSLSNGKRTLCPHSFSGLRLFCMLKTVSIKMKLSRCSAERWSFLKSTVNFLSLSNRESGYSNFIHFHLNHLQVTGNSKCY